MDALLVLAGRQPAAADDATAAALRLVLPFVRRGSPTGISAVRRLAAAFAADSPMSVLVAWWGKAVLGIDLRELRSADLSSCTAVEPGLRPVLLCAYDLPEGVAAYTRWFVETAAVRAGLAELARDAAKTPALHDVIGRLRTGTYSDADSLIRAARRGGAGDAAARIKQLHEQVGALRTKGFGIGIPVHAGEPRSCGLVGEHAALADEMLAFLPGGERTPRRHVVAEIAARYATVPAGDLDAVDEVLRTLGIRLDEAAPVEPEPVPEPVPERVPDLVPDLRRDPVAASVPDLVQGHLPAPPPVPQTPVRLAPGPCSVCARTVTSSADMSLGRHAGCIAPALGARRSRSRR